MLCGNDLRKILFRLIDRFLQIKIFKNKNSVPERWNRVFILHSNKLYKFKHLKNYKFNEAMIYHILSDFSII